MPVVFNAAPNGSAPTPDIHAPFSPPISPTPLPSTTQSLIGLSQDVAALLSLSIETGASLVHHVYKSTLSTLGLGNDVQPHVSVRNTTQGEGGRGMAVVVIGADESTGRALSLHLAKVGYTVFAMIPLPSPYSPPTSAALSALLLSWSRIQKRLTARSPNHPGAVVPIITDPDTVLYRVDGMGPRSHYAHAGDTIRAYCIEQQLALVAVVCAARSPKTTPVPETLNPLPSPPKKVKFIDEADVIPADASSKTPRASAPCPLVPSLKSVRPGSLALTDDSTLFSMYRVNVVDPIAIIRELEDLLSHSPSTGKGRSRIVFVNNHSGTIGDTDNESSADQRVAGITRVIGTARAEATRLLHEDLSAVGIDVCEVLVGPMISRPISSRCHRRSGSDESNDSNSGRQRAIADALRNGERRDSSDIEETDNKQLARWTIPSDWYDAHIQVLSQRLAMLSRIWAVDDALLFSAVRRAIEDRYPRYRHHAGLSPLIASIAEVTPGAGIVQMIGRWLVRRLFMPRK